MKLKNAITLHRKLFECIQLRNNALKTEDEQIYQNQMQVNNERLKTSPGNKFVIDIF